MANKTKQQERDRRATVEAMRKAQQAKERRKSMLFIVLATVIGLGLVAAAAIPAYLDNRDDPANKALSSFGVSAASASCDKPTNDPATGGNDHKPDGAVVEYAQVPPSSGAHWAAPAFPAREFYTARDRPELEQLVHNLEHGYTILWYDAEKAKGKEQILRDIADQANKKAESQDKFLVVEWDSARGALPKPFALAHWSKDAGHRQLCGDISGAVIVDFIEKHPASDTQEPGAA